MARPSPDGEWLTWATFPTNELWRSRRDGSERLRLTTDAVRGWVPSWSPDGKWIAFAGAEPRFSRLSLQLVAADGGPIEMLVPSHVRSGFWDPCWLLDGRSLVFSELTLGPGRGIHRIDLTTRTVTLFDGAQDFVFPRCGPRGHLLALRPPGVGGPSRPAAFLLYEPERRAWEEIAPHRLEYPTWTRDGRSFCGLALQENRIECYSLAARRFETVAEISGNPLLTWVGVPWFGLDADDNPLVMLDRSTRDLYALDWEG